MPVRPMPSQDPSRLAAVVDLGGSTEIVCGEEDEGPHRAVSLSLGSSAWSRRFFKGGTIDPERFRQAILAARHEFDPMRKAFHGTCADD